MEDTAKYEVDRKHSPLPWESDIDVDGVAITCNKGKRGIAIDMSVEDCLFMVKACNSYYDNQQRIQELEEALQVLINNIKAEHRGGKLAEHSILVRQSIKHAKEVLRTP